MNHLLLLSPLAEYIAWAYGDHGYFINREGQVILVGMMN